MSFVSFLFFSLLSLSSDDKKTKLLGTKATPLTANHGSKNSNMKIMQQKL